MRRPLALFIGSTLAGMTLLFDSGAVLLAVPVVWTAGVLFLSRDREDLRQRFLLAAVGLVLGLGLTWTAGAWEAPWASTDLAEIRGQAKAPWYGEPGRLLIEVEAVGTGTVLEEARGRVLLIGEGDLTAFRHRRIRFEGSLEKEKRPGNPGEFDYGLLNRTRGYDAVVFFDPRTDRLEDLGEGTAWDPGRLKAYVLDRSGACLEPRSQAYFAALVFGDTSLLTDVQKDRIAMAGLSHLFAVSGLHMAVLFAFLRRAAGWTLPGRSGLADGAALLGGFLFLLVIGAPTASVRAFIFLCLLVLSRLARRRYDLLNALLLAAFLILLHNPYQLLAPGFQLSFAAVASIHWIYPVMTKWFRAGSRVAKAFCVSLSVQIGIAPILVCHFGQLSLVSVLANVPAVLAVAALLPFLYLFAFALGTEVPLASAAPAWVAGKALALLDIFAVRAAGVPNAALELPFAGAGWTLAYYSLLGVGVAYAQRQRLIGFKRVERLILLLTVLILVAVPVSKALEADPFRVVFYDVGQGDGALLETPSGHLILIDGGSRRAGLEEILLKNGIGRIDLAVLTHFHEDHYGGLEALAEAGRIERLVVKESAYQNDEIRSRLEAAMEKAGKSVIRPEKMGRIVLDGVCLELLNPDRIALGDDPESRENNDSLAFMVRYGAFDLLLAGDLEQEAEKRLAVSQGQNVEIMKANHHGSKSSNTPVFLEAFDPEVVVVSVGANVFGHPSEEVLDSMRALPAEVYRTDWDGAVSIETDGGSTYRIKTYLSNRSERYGMD